MLKKVRYALEGLGFTAIYSVYGLLSPQAAANLGSFILRILGPLLPVAKRARANILKAFPNTTAQNLRHILQGMWDHLGRLSGEFAHGLFFRKPENHQLIQIVGAEIIARLQASGGPIVFATGHFGSWQMIPIALERLQLPVFQLYRAANNPVSDRILQKAQRDSGVTEAIRKGPHGLKNLTKRLKAGQSVLIFQSPRAYRTRCCSPSPAFQLSPCTCFLPAFRKNKSFSCDV